MSNTKTVMGQASNQYAAPTDITDVFSTYLYTGNGSTQTITNDIDLANEGGLVWIQERDDGTNSYSQLFDTERGANKSLTTQVTNAQSTETQTLMTFNSDGFNLGTDGGVNASTKNNVAWTFRKAPKFFDVIKYSGDSNATRSIPHGLGSSVGMIIIKTLNANDNWLVYHRGLPNGLGTGRLKLNLTNAVDGTTNFLSADSSSVTFASNAGGNYSGNEYVMYLFAHNDGDGGFGPTNDQDIIKCGSYTGDGSTDGSNVIDLGWEPQWVMVKVTSTSDSWMILDNMRGIGGTKNNVIRADSSGAEEQDSNAMGTLLPNGFSVTKNNDEINGPGQTYIYMAIRRGPLAPPESATEVFAPVIGSGVQSPGFPVDFLIGLNDRTSTQFYDPFVKTRLLGGVPYLTTSSTAAEASGTDVGFDTMDGLTYSWPNSNAVAWYWKRAPGFFDVVSYSGTGSVRTVSHNLGAVPEMMWMKRRNSTGNWEVYYDTGNPSVNNGLGLLRINSTSGDLNGTYMWGNTHPTDTVFTVGTQSGVNNSSGTYIAYLFASLPGISKVGSYTGTGATLNIDCGFTSGARFVVIKRTDAGGQWFVFDSTRGIVSGNDPFLRLNSNGAEETAYDIIDPLSSGFSLTSNNDWETNISGGSYIFYAIA